jgi:hypothetical protein
VLEDRRFRLEARIVSQDALRLLVESDGSLVVLRVLQPAMAIQHVLAFVLVSIDRGPLRPLGERRIRFRLVFPILAVPGTTCRRKSLVFSWVFVGIPYSTEQGILKREQEIIPPEQGISVEQQEKPRSGSFQRRLGPLRLSASP